MSSRSSSRRLPRLALALAALSAAPASAHPGTHERIAAATKKIEAAPDDPVLWAKRGQLRCEHGELSAAARDFARARKLAPREVEVHLREARAWLEVSRPRSAERALDRLLAIDPASAAGLTLRARARAALRRPADALADLEVAIPKLDPPDPEMFLLRARLQIREGSAAIADIMAGLDEGIAQTGGAITLMTAAVDVELQHERPDAALDRLLRLPLSLQATPAWLETRARIWTSLGEPLRAQADRETAAALRSAGKT